MAETLLIGILFLAGFFVMFVVDAHGKARAYQRGRVGPTPERPPEAVTSVDLPLPRFNEREKSKRRRDS